MPKAQKKSLQSSKPSRKQDGDSHPQLTNICEPKSRLWITSIILFGLTLSCLHTWHISTIFENDRHFSHLADFEREMSYRTEMGFYYSFYKTMINASSFVDGLYLLTHDNASEFGHTINTIKRFNLYPEIILSAAYRVFKRFADIMKWKVEVCWRTNRGQGLSPVDSCEGIGNQHYFYVTSVFNLFGTVATSIFFLGVLVSNSILGGLLAVASFFFNHGEATRVQWTPSLRESFGYPIFISQILLITFVLRNNLHGFRWWLLISYLTSLFMLFWQFAGFALSTQVGSLFAVFILDFVPLNTMMTILRGHMVGFLLGFCLLFGNEMLLTSLHFSSTVTFLFILYLDPLLRRIEFRPFYLLLTSAIFVTGCLSLRVLIGRSLHIEDDAHIFDILRSKFSDFANFHTRLYTCAREFDFLGMDTVSVLLKTLLLPAAIFASFSFLTYIFRTEVPTLLWRNLERSKPYPEIMYNLIQLVCFGLMAGLIMRLKLFLTPHLCIITALLANRKLMNVSFGFPVPLWIQRTFLFALLATMAFDGFSNIKKQRNIQGEYSNIDQEKLFEWIMRNTPADAVFAGTMPVMANVKLTTNRPIVNHPHYEDVGLRARTLTVYSLFSKKPLEEVYSSLKKMGIQYYVYQQAWCSQNNPKPECTYRSMWDLQDPANVRRESLCDIIQNAVITNNETLISPIKIVYNAYNYVVFKF